jgi:hypothetical protein
MNNAKWVRFVHGGGYEPLARRTAEPRVTADRAAPGAERRYLWPENLGASMTHIEGSPGEIHELARYEVRPEALDEVIAAIHEFVAYVRENEAGALRYEVSRRRGESAAW